MVFLLLFSLSLSSSVFQCCDSHKTGLCEKDCGQHPGCCGFPGLVHPFYSFCLLTPGPLPTLPTPCHAGCYSMDRPVNCLRFGPSQLYWSTDPWTPPHPPHPMSCRVLQYGQACKLPEIWSLTTYWFTDPWTPPHPPHPMSCWVLQYGQACKLPEIWSLTTYWFTDPWTPPHPPHPMSCRVLQYGQACKLPEIWSLTTLLGLGC